MSETRSKVPVNKFKYHIKKPEQSRTRTRIDHYQTLRNRKITRIDTTRFSKEEARVAKEIQNELVSHIVAAIQLISKMNIHFTKIIACKYTNFTKRCVKHNVAITSPPKHDVVKQIINMGENFEEFVKQCDANDVVIVFPPFSNLIQTIDITDTQGKELYSSGENKKNNFETAVLLCSSSPSIPASHSMSQQLFKFPQTEKVISKKTSLAKVREKCASDRIEQNKESPQFLSSSTYIYNYLSVQQKISLHDYENQENEQDDYRQAFEEDIASDDLPDVSYAQVSMQDPQYQFYSPGIEYHRIDTCGISASSNYQNTSKEYEKENIRKSPTF